MHYSFLHLAFGAALATAAPVLQAQSGINAQVAVTDSAPSNAAKKSPDRTFLEVDNTAYLDANVYALQGYRRVRLGTVNGLSKQTLAIPRTLVDPGLPLRFMIHPIGGWRNSVSDELVVYQGDTVNLYVPPF